MKQMLSSSRHDFPSGARAGCHLPGPWGFPGSSIALAPETINLTLSGAQQRVDRIRPENITAYVRCDQLDASTTYDLPVQVDLPDGIILNNTEPSVVKVSISLTP